jgi:transposase
VNTAKFVEFLKVLQMNAVPGRIILFIDNLVVHNSSLAREYAQNNGIEIVFNASYSSEFKAVERL